MGNFVSRLRRKWRAKGHGVHSPFAFNLIRNVIHSPHAYYAFFDIEKLLWENCFGNAPVNEFNRLSFRLVHHFNATSILEIHSGKGINTLFVASPRSDIVCTCVENDTENISIAKLLHEHRNVKAEITHDLSLIHKQPFDAIFVYLNKDEIPSIDTLLSLSHEHTFWALYPLKSKSAKQFWRKIVKDERTKITFDVEDVGIVFLHPSHHKLNYLI